MYTIGLHDTMRVLRSCNGLQRSSAQPLAMSHRRAPSDRYLDVQRLLSHYESSKTKLVSGICIVGGWKLTYLVLHLLNYHPLLIL